jgi:hypothetical protein
MSSRAGNGNQRDMRDQDDRCEEIDQECAAA